MWIDAHAHLFGLSEDECTTQIAEASAHGVEVILSTATDLENAEVVHDQCCHNSIIYGAVGISPFDVVNLPEEWAAKLASLLTCNKIVGVGEIGIDATNPAYPPLSRQQPVFEQQLDLAKKFTLPAVIHSRGAEDDAVAICRNIGITDAVFHCFTGSRAALTTVIDQGYYVSLSGILTFRNCALREYIHNIPLDRLLIETDCPYLAPVPHRGKSNRPAWVRYVGEEVSRLLGIATEQLAEQIRNNFKRIFRRINE